MLRQTHLPVRTPPADISQLQYADDNSLASWDPSADMSQLQHTEDDSMARGDLPQMCPSYTVLRKTHLPVKTVMSQLQHAEDDSLSADMFSYNMLRMTHWPVHLCRCVPATTCWGWLTGQYTSVDVSQLQHAEDDSLASGDPLRTCPSYNMLMTTHWPVETPCRPSAMTLSGN